MKNVVFWDVTPYDSCRAVTMNNGVFWDVAPCGSYVGCYLQLALALVRTDASEELSASIIRYFFAACVGC
jgi:hypothetical protein